MWRVTVWLVAAAQLAACSDYLLPSGVVPRHYDLRYTFDIDPETNFSFYAVVNILLKAKSPVNQIVLHAQDFNIPEGAILLTGPGSPEVTSFSINETFNFLTIKLDRHLMEDANYSLTIPFYGNLKPGLDGAYISSYVDSDTKVKEYLITTQFEATSARKALPCFDEPIYKATFGVTIGHHVDYNSVSNMPISRTSSINALEDYWAWTAVAQSFKKDMSKFVWDTFETSVPMSTYLVAFVVSKFIYVESAAELSHVKFKIWARKDAINQTMYAAEIGPKVLSHFEQWFNVSYPLPKQDMFAIPDFAAGAMENWGLITYREASLLYDKAYSSFVNKERVAEVIAHELAHQWFGNLVTMKWWSDLWLNEGFATYVASLGVAAVEPQWKADLNYAVDNILSVLSLDSLESSHPVSVALDDPKRIHEIFDEISYRKGSTLIRMMTMFLGEEVFRKAIHQYLIKYSYSNAEQDDLWRELYEVSQEYGGLTRNVTVKEVMDTWTTQTGYPLLTVTRDYTDNTVTVTQKRFLNLGAKSSTAVSWWIPLRVMCEREADQPPEPVEWLAKDEGVKNKHQFEHGSSADEWILFNADMIAPYRVNYDARNWELLSRTLAGGRVARVPLLARVQLLSDAFALAWSEKLDYSTVLQLANYLQHEKEYLPLSTGLRALSKLDTVLKRTADYGAFQKFVRKLITEQYQTSGGLYKKAIINGNDLKSVKMQTLTSSWACRMKVPGCEDNAIELYKNWMNTPDPDENNPIPLDLRKTVYCVAVSRGSVAEWRFALARFSKANVAAAKLALQTALSCTRELWILSQYLEMTITEGSEVRRQDAGRVISDIVTSNVGYYVGKEFIYTRIEEIFQAFEGQNRRLGHIVKALLGQFTTQRELDEFLAWRDENAKYLEDAKLAVEQAIEATKLNIAWLARNRKGVVDKLRQYAIEIDEDDRRSSGCYALVNSVVMCTMFIVIYII